MSKRPYVLAAVALALAALVVREYWPSDPSSAPATVSGTAPPRPVAVTLNPLSQRPDIDFAALFDHPLFDPTRTKATPEPLPTEVAPPQTQAETAAPVALGPAQPVLMGTVTSPWPGGVYLGDDQGGPVVFLRPGEAALGLHLEEARATSALFMGPEGEVTLTLQQAAPVATAPDGQAPVIPDPNVLDPNAPDMGAMAPGAIDPSMTDPGAPDATAPQPEVAKPEAIAPKMPSAP
jgi:hypothetical protein